MISFLRLLLLSLNAEAYFILSHNILETTRVDPIVSPGGVSQHVHSVVGGSNFAPVLTYNSSLASKCTTAAVTLDKSSYWTPQLYYYNPTDETYQAIPVAFVNTYYLPRYGKDGKVQAFPDGLRMISGNPYRRTFDGTPDSKAITFVCLDYAGGHQGDPEWAERNSFFNHNCPNGMRAQVFFRSCWDGVNLDSPDHLSHMAWPSGGVDGGECPASHPVRLVSLFYEFIYNTQDFPFNPAGTPTWVFANGDTTGYGMHGDFANGWASVNGTSVLQQAIDGCNENNGVGGELQNCPPFVPYLDRSAAQACGPENGLVDEDVGLGHPISRLPGDNPLWIGEGPKPSWTNYTEGNTTYTDFKSKIPDGYVEVGCVAEGTSGRALQGASLTAQNMTRAVCVSFCQSRGFPLAGMEYGKECYCGILMAGGASNTTLAPSTDCNMKCVGNGYETCGGPSRLNLYNNADMYPKASLPDGWKYVGCQTEATSGRALTGYSITSNDMTHGKCIAACSAKSFTYAGVEYGRECYCGNSLGAGSTQAAEGECAMACAGDSLSQCGGPSRLSLFTTRPPATASPWTHQGCFTEATSGRALQGFSTSSSSMTIETCLSMCQERGVAYCGMEYSSECYGGNILATGAQQADASQCNMKCSGNKTESCGGSSRLDIYETNQTPSSDNVPASWSDNGCWTEAQSGRTLSNYSFASKDMTPSLCVSTCQAKGYSLAGIEYSSECYCGNAFVGNSTAAPRSDCAMTCSGDGGSLCGGPKRLNTYRLSQ